MKQEMIAVHNSKYGDENKSQYLDDLDGGKFEAAIEFSCSGAFQRGREPLEQLIVGAEFGVVFFCDDVTLYHQRQTRNHLCHRVTTVVKCPTASPARPSFHPLVNSDLSLKL